MTSNYVPGPRLEFARFYGETGHFKLNFSIENSNFSQFFVSGIHIHTFFHNFAEKKFRFIGTLSLTKLYGFFPENFCHLLNIFSANIIQTVSNYVQNKIRKTISHYLWPRNRSEDLRISQERKQCINHMKKKHRTKENKLFFGKRRKKRQIQGRQ